MHVQNMEQLHAHDRYQNVTEHKPQATVQTCTVVSVLAVAIEEVDGSCLLAE